MLERAWWHPVADAAALGDAPQAVTLLGEELVLWRDHAGQPRAFADRCPHRGTRLSLGRVCEGRLECAYHGWQFGPDGGCAHVPASPGFVPPASHRATPSAACIAYGLIWVRLDAAGRNAPPPFHAETDPRLRKLLVGPYDVATSAPRIVENFLDMAHFGFVHEGVLGDRAHTAVPAYEVQLDANGLRATGCMAWQPRSHSQATQGSWVAYDYAVPAPYTALLSKAATDAGRRDTIALFVCPIEPERSRVWFRLALCDFESSDEALRAFQDQIFLQDRPVLESQTPKRLPLTAGEMHSAADRACAAYRRWLLDLKIGFGTV
ncbi:MAG: aromatic ring-hydroxylating dioxygenase subunit alpha [Burkholderiales bacterium]|nr:aromatic ring-hydroxylating dioxygenase subunit alpha [Burkholderiales bacterium]